MKKLDFYFKPKDASSTKSFDTSQAGVSDSLPESLPSPLDSQNNLIKKKQGLFKFFKINIIHYCL